MPRFAANLTMLFTDVPLIERFGRARSAGFNAVEFLFPYDEDLDAIERELKEHDLKLVLFNLPAGDFAGGERGIANDPGRVAEFREGVERALEIAQRFSVPQLNCLVGLTMSEVALRQQWETASDNLRYAAEEAAKAGVVQLVEPVNTIDAPGYMLSSIHQALELLERVHHDNLKLQMDIYHEQRMAGNLTATFHEFVDRIAHVQIADSPARHEPGTGEINYQFVLSEIDRSGYEGYVSLEYNPSSTTEESLGWLREYGYW